VLHLLTAALTMLRTRNYFQLQQTTQKRVAHRVCCRHQQRSPTCCTSWLQHQMRRIDRITSSCNKQHINLCTTAAWQRVVSHYVLHHLDCRIWMQHMTATCDCNMWLQHVTATSNAKPATFYNYVLHLCNKKSVAHIELLLFVTTGLQHSMTSCCTS